MGYTLITRNEILTRIQLNPQTFWSTFSASFPSQLIGYTNGPYVTNPEGYVTRAWTYELLSDQPTDMGACFFKASGGYPPCRDGWFNPSQPEIEYYAPRSVNLSFFWTQQYTHPNGTSQTTTGTDNSHSYFYLNSGIDSPPEGDTRQRSYFEGEGTINYPVFKTEEDAIKWGQLVHDYYDNPSLENLYKLKEQLFKSLNPFSNDPNEEEPGGSSEEGGGDGDHNRRYDVIPVPGLPSLGAAGAGFIYMLRLSASDMSLFADDLLNPTFWQAIKAFFSDPIDFICGIMVVPFQPTTGALVKPKFGTNVFQNAFPLITNQYHEINCGNLYLTKYFGSCFDFNPYTKLTIWLPYIGYRELNADDVMGGIINIKYHCDCVTGDCVAFISSVGGGGSGTVNRVIAQFTGNCGVRVPFGRTSYDAAVAASIQLLGGAVGALAGAAAGAAGLANTSDISASQVASSVSSGTVTAINGMKVTSERSGTAGASAGYMSIQKPYLLRQIPRQSLPEGYANLEGYPSNISGTLSQFSGFAAVESIKLSGIPATDDELREIQSLLIGGVFI